MQNHLDASGATPSGKSQGVGGKSDRYPIGTAAVIQHEKTIYYLLAISDFDNRNLARSSREFIKNAVEKLLDYYDDLGMGYKIYMPVLGTGKSRARLKPKESLQLIKETFVEREEKINGQIYIVALDTMIAELS